MFVPICRLTGHGADVTRGRVSPDGRTITSGSADKSMLVWDTATGEALRSFSGHPSEISDLCYHESGLGVLTSCIDGKLRLFDFRSSSSGASLSLSAHDDAPEYSCLAVGSSVNSPLVVGGTTCGRLMSFDLRRGTLVMSALAHYNSLSSLATSEDDDMLISSSLDGTIRLWSTKQGDCLMTVTDGTSNQAPCVYAGFTGNGAEFTGLFLDSVIRRWKTSDRIYCQGKVIGPKMTNSTKTFASISSQAIAVPSEDGYVHFLDLSTGKTVQAPKKAHADDILSVDVRGDVLVSTGAGEDSSAVIWIRSSENLSHADDYNITYALVSPQIEGLV